MKPDLTIEKCPTGLVPSQCGNDPVISLSVFKFLAPLLDGKCHVFVARMAFSKIMWRLHSQNIIDYCYLGVEKGQSPSTELVIVRLHKRVLRYFAPRANGPEPKQFKEALLRKEAKARHTNGQITAHANPVN